MMKKILFISMFISVTIFAQDNDYNTMLDTLYLKNGTMVKGVIKSIPNTTKKIKMCEANSRNKTGKCIKYEANVVDKYVKFYNSLKKVNGILGFGKKEYETRYNTYYSVVFDTGTEVFAELVKTGNNYEFYRQSWIDYQTMRNYILVTNPNNRKIVAWYKSGNTNEQIRNAKSAFPKCEKELENFRKNKDNNELSVFEVIDNKCD